jgi:hypothetical protein
VLAATGIGLVCWGFGLLGAGLVVARRDLGPAPARPPGRWPRCSPAWTRRASPIRCWPPPCRSTSTGWSTVVTAGGGLGLLLTGWAALSVTQITIRTGNPTDAG